MAPSCSMVASYLNVRICSMNVRWSLEKIPAQAGRVGNLGVRADGIERVVGANILLPVVSLPIYGTFG